MDAAQHRKQGSLPQRLHLDLNQLEQAIAAANCGSFRQAAEALSIKQSTLSRSIKLLEQSFGVAIFVRTSGGVQATPIGRRFLRTASSIVEQLHALSVFTRASGRGDAGRLVVGFCTSLTAGNLRATLIEYRRRFPQVELRTIERSRTALITALRNGVIDVHIITGEMRTRDFKTNSLWSERILVALPKDHPLASREAIYWTDLRDQVLLLSHYDPGLEFETLLNAKLADAHDHPRIERHDVSRGVIKSLVSMGVGISLVLESDIGASFAGLVYKEVRDGVGPSRIGFSGIWHDDNENPALANFLELLSERYPIFPDA